MTLRMLTLSDAEEQDLLYRPTPFEHDYSSYAVSAVSRFGKSLIESLPTTPSGTLVFVLPCTSDGAERDLVPLK